MAVTTRQKLKLISLAKRKRNEEQARVDELTSLVNQVVGSNIRHGERGEQGSIGSTGLTGKQGVSGARGVDGKDGVTEVIHSFEPLPEDVVKKDTLEEVRRDLESVKRSQRHSIGAGSNSGEGVKYVNISVAEYKISKSELLRNGITIFGVNYPGAVSITVPQPKKNQIVYINDESGNADSNNITVTTLQS